MARTQQSADPTLSPKYILLPCDAHIRKLREKRREGSIVSFYGIVLLLLILEIAHRFERGVSFHIYSFRIYFSLFMFGKAHAAEAKKGGLFLPPVVAAWAFLLFLILPFCVSRSRPRGLSLLLLLLL